ncbi:MAG: FKBP-type peptidyl-prolyl cis-trans isomerase, partial [Acidobacteriota bacterium]|nr:FKBP-type peptidyl-prolyl cis-trans isomerase [Acidobacteriota bacterium]
LLGRDPQVDLNEYRMKIQGMVQAKMLAAAEKEKEESNAYVETMSKKDGAQMTTSGAIYFEVEAGDGAAPAATDRVTVHYHGTLPDGTVFDSSVDRGEPVTFSLNGVVPCFSEGIQMMKVGGKAKLVCPSDTAYGDRGSPPLIKPGAAINFDVELIEIAAGS